MDTKCRFCGTKIQIPFYLWSRQSFWFTKEELDHLAKNRVYKSNSVVKEVQEYGMLLENPNQRSMHSCGIIISEEPIIITRL
jgi:DNA polymerase-3 subunit alpha/error-prone DNA polymerase